jgi:hypothetical protein
VRDGVEARLGVSVQHPPLALGAEPLNLGDSVVRAPHRPEPVGDGQEVCFEDGLQYELQRRLHDPVRDRRDAELADLPSRAQVRILRSRTGSDRNDRPLRRLAGHPGTRHPDGLLDLGGSRDIDAGSVLAPWLPATRSNATLSAAGSCTKL